MYSILSSCWVHIAISCFRVSVGLVGVNVDNTCFVFCETNRIVWFQIRCLVQNDGVYQMKCVDLYYELSGRFRLRAVPMTTVLRSSVRVWLPLLVEFGINLILKHATARRLPPSASPLQRTTSSQATSISAEVSYSAVIGVQSIQLDLGCSAFSFSWSLVHVSLSILRCSQYVFQCAPFSESSMKWLRNMSTSCLHAKHRLFDFSFPNALMIQWMFVATARYVNEISLNSH